MPKRGLKPWSEVWDDIVRLGFIDLTDADPNPNEDGWISVRCPFHDDNSPSMRVNLETGSVKCMRGCTEQREITNLNHLELAALDTAVRHTKKPRDPVGDLARRRKLPKDFLIERFGLVSTSGGYLFDSGDPLIDPNFDTDEEREMDDEDRRQSKRKRPKHQIFKRGAWIDPEKTRWPKYAWRPKLGKSKISARDLVYNLERVESDHVIVAAGPPDVWVLDYVGFDAISFMAGEGAAPSSRAVNRVYAKGVREATIIYDNDQTGRKGAEEVAIALSRHGIDCVVLELPPELGEKADITDLWVHCEGDRDQFVDVLEDCRTRKWTADVRVEAEELYAPEPLKTLPEDVWIEPFDAYRRSLEKSTQAPQEFHYFALLNVIGALFGRRIMTYYARDLYPNQYTCLVGPTGKAKKTTAMQYALQLAEDIEDIEGRNRPVFETRLRKTEASGSAEGIMEAMAFADIDDPEAIEYTRIAMGQKRGRSEEERGITEEALYKVHQRRLLIVQDEFTHLLAKSKAGQRGGGSTMVPLLLRAFDAPKEIRLPTRNRPLVIVNSVVSILSGSTVEFLTKFFDEDEWYNGFGNRILFVEGEPRGHIADPKRPETKAWEFTVEYLRDIFMQYSRKSYNLDFKLTNKAEKLWAERYEAWQQSREDADEDLLAATQRTDLYARKVALVLAAIDPDQDFDGDEFTITSDDVRRAWAVAEVAEQATRHLVERLAVERNAVFEQQIREFLRRKGSASRRALGQRFSRLGSETLNRLIHNMETAELIERNEVGDYVLTGVSYP